MLHFLSLFLLMVAGALSPMPPASQDPNPILATSIVDGVPVNVHANGMLSAVAFIVDEGTPLASFGFEGVTVDPAEVAKMLPQGPMGTAPTPTLTTTWVDAAGVTHTVSTPIASSTPAGLKAATDLHEQLVQIMQRKHPPRPVPPGP